MKIAQDLRGFTWKEKEGSTASVMTSDSLLFPRIIYVCIS